jgi:hypothetical protein
MLGADVFIEDLNSTNGTYINGKAIKKRLLAHNDMVEVGKYRIRYLVDQDADYERTAIYRPGAAADAAPPSEAAAPEIPGPSYSIAAALVKVLNGSAAGREVNLIKVVTTVGKPGVQVAAITKRPTGYVLAHVEGAQRPTVNGNPLVGETVPLRNGDVIELAGTQMQFVQP